MNTQTIVATAETEIKAGQLVRMTKRGTIRPSSNLGPDGKPWRSRFSPHTARTDRPENRPDMRPFVIKLLSTHKHCPKKGMKRIQAVVKLLGVTKTVHMDVPQDFNI